MWPGQMPVAVPAGGCTSSDGQGPGGRCHHGLPGLDRHCRRMDLTADSQCCPGCWAWLAEMPRLAHRDNELGMSGR
jgi:hypothetical protein